jgi:phosphatidylinositol glycan class C protein
MSAREWEKVLWKTQSYPDNHIPEKYFLASLRKNRKLVFTIEDL